MSETLCIELMTTSGCHLCEQAAQMLNYWLSQDKSAGDLFVYREVEISDSPQLVEAYGVRIPVIRFGEAELGWPFSYEQMVDWLKEHRELQVGQ